MVYMWNLTRRKTLERQSVVVWLRHTNARDCNPLSQLCLAILFHSGRSGFRSRWRSRHHLYLLWNLWGHYSLRLISSPKGLASSCITLSIHGGRVAWALACNARGDGFARHLRRYFRDLFSRIDTVSGTEGLKMVCEALRELTVPCNVSGDNW